MSQMQPGLCVASWLQLAMRLLHGLLPIWDAGQLHQLPMTCKGAQCLQQLSLASPGLARRRIHRARCRRAVGAAAGAASLLTRLAGYVSVERCLGRGALGRAGEGGAVQGVAAAAGRASVLQVGRRLLGVCSCCLIVVDTQASWCQGHLWAQALDP